jgi:hypothetical protein
MSKPWLKIKDNWPALLDKKELRVDFDRDVSPQGKESRLQIMAHKLPALRGGIPDKSTDLTIMRTPERVSASAAGFFSCLSRHFKAKNCLGQPLSWCVAPHRPASLQVPPIVGNGCFNVRTG